MSRLIVVSNRVNLPREAGAVAVGGAIHVMGGRVKDPRSLEFTDLGTMDLVGIYPDFATAKEAWKASAQRTVDDAEMKYVIVHLHRVLEPDLTED